MVDARIASSGCFIDDTEILYPASHWPTFDHAWRPEPQLSDQENAGGARLFGQAVGRPRGFGDEVRSPIVRTVCAYGLGSPGDWAGSIAHCARAKGQRGHSWPRIGTDPPSDDGWFAAATQADTSRSGSTLAAKARAAAIGRNICRTTASMAIGSTPRRQEIIHSCTGQHLSVGWYR